METVARRQKYVFDACALLAYFRNEPGADAVQELMWDSIGYIHAVNLCEIYYVLLRQTTEAEARAVIDDIASIGMHFHDWIDTAFWQQVGRFKAILPISLADCFCLTLATQEGAEIITSDHEFDIVAQQGICPVTFIR